MIEAMVAPPEVPRNAERGRKAKAALVEDDPVLQYNAANNTSIIKAGARKPRPGWCEDPIGTEGGCPDQIPKQKPASKDHNDP